MLFKYLSKWCTYSTTWLLHGWCQVKGLPSRRMFCVHHITMHQFTVSFHLKIYAMLSWLGTAPPPPLKVPVLPVNCCLGVATSSECALQRETKWNPLLSLFRSNRLSWETTSTVVHMHYTHTNTHTHTHTQRNSSVYRLPITRCQAN